MGKLSMTHLRFLLALLLVLLGACPAGAAGTCVLDRPASFMDGKGFADMRVLVLFSHGAGHKPADLLKALGETALGDNAQQGNLMVVADVEAGDMVATATSSGRQDLIVVVDDAFMVDGKPKYNDLLSVYRDTAIAPDNVLLLDGMLRTSRESAVVGLMQASISDRLMAHLIEGAALFAYLGRPDGQVVEYISDLIVDAGSVAHAAEVIKDRRPVLFKDCLQAD